MVEKLLRDAGYPVEAVNAPAINRLLSVLNTKVGVDYGVRMVDTTYGSYFLEPRGTQGLRDWALVAGTLVAPSIFGGSIGGDCLATDTAGIKLKFSPAGINAVEVEEGSRIPGFRDVRWLSWSDPVEVDPFTAGKAIWIVSTSIFLPVFDEQAKKGFVLIFDCKKLLQKRGGGVNLTTINKLAEYVAREREKLAVQV